MYKMRTEVPLCTRCCFCLPLRYGLLVWGYVKLFVIFLNLTSFTPMFEIEMADSIFNEHIENSDIIFTCIGYFILVVDLGLTITYIVGCYKKNVRLLRIFYIYSTIIACLATVLSIYFLGISVYFMTVYGNKSMALGLTVQGIMEAMIFLGNIALQIYMIFLIRSEIVKLNNKGQCTFVNNAAEAQCTLNINNSNEMPENEKSKKDGYDCKDRTYV